MSERISFQCQHCGKSLSAKAKYAGRSGKCKGCGLSITVPDSEVSVNEWEGGVQSHRKGFLNSLGGLSRIPQSGELDFPPEAFYFLSSLREKIKHGYISESFFQLSRQRQQEVIESKDVKYANWFPRILGQRSDPSQSIESNKAQTSEGRPGISSQESQGAVTSKKEESSATFLNQSGGLAYVPSGKELAGCAEEAALFVLDFCKKLDARLFDEEFFSFDPEDQKQLLENCDVRYREYYDELIGRSSLTAASSSSDTNVAKDNGTPFQAVSPTDSAAAPLNLAKPDFKKIDRQHVLRAIKELNEVVDHGFAKSTKYVLNYDGRRYSPKAVLGVAYQVATGYTIGPSDFSGGNQSGQANYVLRQLGFDVVTIEELEAESTQEVVSQDVKPILPVETEGLSSKSSEAEEQKAAAISFKLPDSFEHFQLDKKLELLRDSYSRDEFAHWLHAPISSLAKETDRHLPQAFLGHKIGDFLKLSLYQIQREPGVGDTKIHRLFSVLTRGLQENAQPEELGGDAPYSDQASFGLSGFESVTLGTVADSLSNVSSGLWDLNVGDLIGKSSAELQDIPGVGASKAEEIETQLGNIKQSFQKRDESGFYTFHIKRRDIAEVEKWCFETAESQAVPSAVEFRMNFVVPILKIVENDFDTEMRHIVQGRIGLNEPPKTLKELGEDYNLTRERIRQKLVKVVEAIEYRFPRGNTLLSLVAARAGNSIESSDLNKLIRECRSAFFETEREGEQSTARPSAKEILSAWSRQGREHQTPFSHAELLQWVADEFPGVVDNFAMELILSDSLMTQLPNGNRIFLTNRIEDRAYAHLLNHSGMIQLSQLAEELDAMERSLKVSLASDQRVAMDDDHNVVLLEDIGFKRLEGNWFLNLAPIQDSPDLDNEVIIPLDTLVNSVLTGLPGKDIYDATVWGVYRYLSDLLEYEYRSAFPLGIDAIILADILVAHSDGRIRNMRRRRLRWDDEEAPVALGKIGWVGVCVTKSNLAITVDELDALLQETYQDYADYVLEQLDTNEPEDGSDGVKFEVVKVPRSGLPLIVTPANELADSAHEHCSLMVSSALGKLSSMEIYKIQQLGNKWLNRELSGDALNGAVHPLQPAGENTNDEVPNVTEDDDELDVSFENEELTDYADIPESSVPMVKAVFKLLLEEGEPMRIGRIRQGLIEREVKIPGQGKDANIIVYLRKSKDFCRTAVGTYALSQWGLKTIDKPKVGWQKSSRSSKSETVEQYHPDGVDRLLGAIADSSQEDRPMQIYEAAYKVLGELQEPTHISRIRELIESKGYFRFGAQDPEGALRVAIDRHANNVEITKPAEPKLFYRHSPATYGLIEWQSREPTSPAAPISSPTNPQAIIASMDAEVWFGLSHWAKVNEQLQPKERSLAYSIGKVLSQGNMPSPKQAKWAVDILRRAKAEGFDTESVKTNIQHQPIKPPKSDMRTDSVNEVLASFILGE